MRGGSGGLLLRTLGHHRLGGDEEPRDGCRILQRRAHDLGRVDDAGLQHVDILTGLCIEALVGAVALEQLADDDRAVDARVLGDEPDRRLQGAADDVDAHLLVVVFGLELRQHPGGEQQCHAAAGHNAFLDRGAGGVHRVVNTILALLHLDLGGAADANDGDTAGELRQALLEFLAVVVGGRLLDLRLDLANPAFDVLLLARAVDDRGVLLLDAHLLGLAEHVERDILELDAEIFADELAAGQDGDVLEHRLAAIAEAWRLHRRHLQAAAQLVDDEGGERLALDILGDDQERPTRLHHRLEHRQHRLQARELLFMQQDEGILQLAYHLLGVRHEIGREIAAIELHALDDVELGLEALRLLDRDHALVADLLHRLGDHLADLALAIAGDGADLGDLVVGRDLLGALLHVLDHRRYRGVDAALEVHRVQPRGHRLDALAHDRLGEHGRGGGTVTGGVVGLLGDFAQHLRAHVLELVGELDLLGDGHAVLGDARRAVRLVEHDIAALGPQCHLHRIGEDIDAAQHAVARVTVEPDFLGWHFSPPSSNLLRRLGLALDDPHDIAFLHDDHLFAVELDLGAGPLAEQHPVAGLDVERMELAILAPRARADGDDLALLGLLLGGVRDDDPAGGLFLLFEAAHHHAVVQGTELHRILLCHGLPSVRSESQGRAAQSRSPRRAEPSARPLGTP